MFHQNRFDGFIGQEKTTVRHGSTDQKPNLPLIIPLVKTCSSTALRSYPSAYPSRLGSLILANQSNCSGMIFYLVSRPSRAFHIPGKVAGTYRHRLYGLPPHTASRSYPEDYICHDDVNLQVLAAARTCRLPGFYFLIFLFGGVLFVHPRLYSHPYPKGTRPYPHRPITAACLSANHNGPFMS